MKILFYCHALGRIRGGGINSNICVLSNWGMLTEVYWHDEVLSKHRISWILFKNCYRFLGSRLWPQHGWRIHRSNLRSCCLIFSFPYYLWDVVIWNVGSMTESITISRTSSRQQERDWHDLAIGHSVIDVKFWLGMFTLVNIHWHFYDFVVAIVWPNMTSS